MSDLISRQNAIEGVKELFACADMGNDECDIAYMLENLPSADKSAGKWIVNILDYKSVCSICGAKETNFIYGTEMWYGLGESKFCPNCGAKMNNNDNE